ncbi:MAG: PleD family two-component system response regulator [Weeksellaceae bacterium]
MKILVAEDDKFFQKFYKSQLVEHGHEVEVTSDGNEALDKLKVSKPDLLLLDIIMPNKDGFEVLTAISQDPSLKVPILIFSTLGQEADIKRAMELGAKGYVNKSFFDLDVLLKKIEEVAHAS